MEIKKAWIVHKGMNTSESTTKIFTGEDAEKEVFEFVKECLKDLNEIWLWKYKKNFELGIGEYPVSYVEYPNLTDEDIQMFIDFGGDFFGNYSLEIDYIDNEKE